MPVEVWMPISAPASHLGQIGGADRSVTSRDGSTSGSVAVVLGVDPPSGNLPARPRLDGMGGHDDQGRTRGCSPWRADDADPVVAEGDGSMATGRSPRGRGGQALQSDGRGAGPGAAATGTRHPCESGWSPAATQFASMVHQAIGAPGAVGAPRGSGAPPRGRTDARGLSAPHGVAERPVADASDPGAATAAVEPRRRPPAGCGRPPGPPSRWRWPAARGCRRPGGG